LSFTNLPENSRSEIVANMWNEL